MELSLHQWLELALGVLYLGLVLAIARRARQLARAFPWLIVLTAFFALRSLERFLVVLDIPMSIMPMLLHTASVLALLLLVVGTHRLADALRDSQEHAEHTGREYERALRDYTQLMRHRLANPLMAIRGGITTLQETELDEQARQQLLDMVNEQAKQLELVALHPEPVGDEEHELDAVARVESAAGRNEQA